MNLQIKIDVMTKTNMDLMVEGFKNVGLAVTFFYLKNGRKQDSWNDAVNGLRIELDGVLVFQAHKKSAVVRFNKLPEDKREQILTFIQDSNIVKQPEYVLGIALTAVFLVLALVVIVSATSESETLGAIMGVLLGVGLVGAAIIGTGSFKMGGNPIVMVGMVIWCVGMVGFAPSSILTVPLVRAMLQNKFPLKTS